MRVIIWSRASVLAILVAKGTAILVAMVIADGVSVVTDGRNGRKTSSIRRLLAICPRRSRFGDRTFLNSMMEVGMMVRWRRRRKRGVWMRVVGREMMRVMRRVARG